MSCEKQTDKTFLNSLSAAELTQYFWQQDTSVPVRGVKEYAPDGTWLEAKQLEVTQAQRIDLLREERVAKIGSIARGEWDPDAKKVRLVKNKRKFWQSMGHSENGIDYLYPEEALFLLDAGMMEIYHGGLPFSLQEAYVAFMGAALSAEQYQVFAFLSRYGYILRRHKPDVFVTDYERKLHIDQYVSNKAKKKKKKRKVSSTALPTQDANLESHGTLAKRPCLEDSVSMASVNESVPEASPLERERTPEIEHMGNQVERLADEEAALITDCGGDVTDLAPADHRLDGPPDGKLTEGTSPDHGNKRSDHLPKGRPPGALTHWDWRTVDLPNTAGRNQLVLHAPPQHLLPPGVEFTSSTHVDLTVFQRQRRAATDPDDMEFSLGGTAWKRGLRAQNWAEYREEYARFMATYSLESSPAGHLWRDSDVIPLVRPQDATTPLHILKRLQIIKTHPLSSHKDRDGQAAEENKEYRGPNIVYDVHLPNSKFKKTSAALPHFHLCIARSSNQVPSLGCLAGPITRNPHIPVHFAIVDGGDINFYGLHEIQLPTSPS